MASGGQADLVGRATMSLRCAKLPGRLEVGHATDHCQEIPLASITPQPCRFEDAPTQSSGHNNLALVQVAQVSMPAHFSHSQDIVNENQLRTYHLIVLFLLDNRRYLLHLLVILVILFWFIDVNSTWLLASCPTKHLPLERWIVRKVQLPYKRMYFFSL